MEGHETTVVAIPKNRNALSADRPHITVYYDELQSERSAFRSMVVPRVCLPVGTGLGWVGIIHTGMIFKKMIIVDRHRLGDPVFFMRRTSVPAACFAILALRMEEANTDHAALPLLAFV